MSCEPDKPHFTLLLGFEQGVCRRRLPVEELFAPETLQSFKI